jgi:toxin ParE1/3/4
MEKRKRVLLSLVFRDDIRNLFKYGVETFGINAAEQYKSDIMQLVYGLSDLCLIYPECRHIPTKNRTYRNIILDSYLIIYRIKPDSVEVLRVIHTSSSIRRIKTARSVKI